jgi:hypothetical protein
MLRWALQWGVVSPVCATVQYVQRRLFGVAAAADGAAGQEQGRPASITLDGVCCGFYFCIAEVAPSSPVPLQS